MSNESVQVVTPSAFTEKSKTRDSVNLSGSVSQKGSIKLIKSFRAEQGKSFLSNNENASNNNETPKGSASESNEVINNFNKLSIVVTRTSIDETNMKECYQSQRKKELSIKDSVSDMKLQVNQKLPETPSSKAKPVVGVSLTNIEKMIQNQSMIPETFLKENKENIDVLSSGNNFKKLGKDHLIQSIENPLLFSAADVATSSKFNKKSSEIFIRDDYELETSDFKRLTKEDTSRSSISDQSIKLSITEITALEEDMNFHSKKGASQSGKNLAQESQSSRSLESDGEADFEQPVLMGSPEIHKTSKVFYGNPLGNIKQKKNYASIDLD